MTDVQDPTFSRDEYAQRLAAVREKMKERGADALIVDQEQHLSYLIGYGVGAQTYQACVVPVDGEPIAIVRTLDESKFLEQSWLRNYVRVADWEDPVEALAAALKKGGWANKRIAVDLDSNYLTTKRYEAIKAALPDATFVDFSDVLWELRLRKSPAEIACLRKAAGISDAAILNAVAAAGEGKSEKVAVLAAFKTYLDMGADPERVGRVASGQRSGTLHADLGDHILQRGDILHMEFTARFKGYSARIMRPAVVGQPSAEQSETAERLVEMQDRQFEAMRPGAVGKAVDHVLRGQMLDSGLVGSYDSITGYTLGYVGQIRTSDFTRIFLPTSEWVLEEGMVFHMYVWARGIAFSETVLVTPDGHERLTKLERKLFAC